MTAMKTDGASLPSPSEYLTLLLILCQALQSAAGTQDREWA